ncbi:MAG: glycosyltransferase family 9 protein [Chthoniobacter sp.]|uniref:glycosyltransferase family 9 protein n=1 Tax=Chthoniobacter sp. TaxID=2510640 RepID=UPI0032AD1AFD
MRILALQLKRIGDLVLTTPALRALHQAWPDAHIALGVMDGTAPLLAAIPFVQSGIVFGRGRGWTPWQQVLTGGWDACFDFTGNDRSALATVLSRARKCVGFEWVRRNRLRSLAYNAWSPSKVRDVHTARHYLDLVAAVAPAGAGDLLPELSLPEASSPAPKPAPYALLHPGTARPEKYWLPERWAEVAAHLQTVHHLPTIFTCGPDDFERAHLAAIASAEGSEKSEVRHPPDLMSLATLVAGARIVISCDTGVVHLASAFRIPQIALFGPTNPFHWRPMHARAVVFSAAQPEAPLTKFEPRLKGAPMEHLSTGAVIRATDSLLALPRPT